MRVLTFSILSLLVLLPSSSFSLYSYIEKEIAAGYSSSNVIVFAADKKLPTGIQAKLALLEHDTSAKLQYLKQLAATDISFALQLADYYLQLEQHSQYLQWTKHSARLQDESAITALISYFYQHKQYQKVGYWLNKSTSKTDSQLAIHSKALLALGLVNQAVRALDDISSPERKKTLAAQFTAFGIFELADLTTNSVDVFQGGVSRHLPIKKQTCLRSISMIATNLDDLNKMLTFKENLAQHLFAAYFCIDNISYVPITSFDCKHNNNAAINCNEALWHTQTSRLATDYLAVMLPQGGANVHYGILYLDSFDSFEVFTHELSHFLGFVDEYAMPNRHQVCQIPVGGKGHNIVLLPRKIAKSTEDSFGSIAHQVVRDSLLALTPWGRLVNDEQQILKDHGDYWQVGFAPVINKSSPLTRHFTSGERLGLFLAETCSQGEYAAFKPLNIATSLRHTDVAFPEEYRDILALSPKQFLMPMYYFNIAASQYRTNQDKLGDYWLTEAKKQQSGPKGH